MLRATVLFLRDRVEIVLSGELTGEWMARLPQTISKCGAAGTVEINLDGITGVDQAGEQALLSLQNSHRHFVCTSSLGRALCEGLGIPVEKGAR